MNLFYEPEIRNGRHFLNEEESRHALKALRLKTGDMLHVIDGKGGRYFCKIVNDKKNCEYEVLEQSHKDSRPFSVHIAIAPTKNQDRMEWFVEKAVETGVEKITFLFTKNSERTRLRMERIRKKAVEAMKQSQNLWLPDIVEEGDFESFLEKKGERQRFIAYVDETHTNTLKDAARMGGDYLALIGPEGDFTREEIELAIKNHFIPVSLGPSRLRTETAGLAVCFTLNLINQ